MSPSAIVTLRPRGGAVLALLAAMTAPAAAQPTDPAVVGQWAPPAAWSTVPIHMSVLPSGKVLSWARNGGATATTWTPGVAGFQPVPLATTDLFCSGHAFLPNGQLLVVGGVEVGAGGEMDGTGVNKTNIFNPANNTWSQKAAMNAARWYPSAVSLSNGEVAVVAGTISPSGGTNQIPQVWKVGGGWRTLRNARLLLSTYPFLHLAPNGQVFQAGPDVVTRYLNTEGDGAWDVVDPHPTGTYRDYGSSVLYDEGKVLLLGGHDPPTATAEVIDLQAPDPRWRAVAPMAYARRHLNATLLPDGKVFVNGGTSGGGFNDPCGADGPRTAELWDPRTETFTPLARAAEIRVYHSTSVLLPDGRVLTGGGGQPPGFTNPACAPDQDHATVEIYSPPYLFRGPRPDLQAAPASVYYAETFSVTTPDARRIAQVTWVRLSSTTHAINQNQRLNHLEFTRITNTKLNITAPDDPSRCPPGHYMLFLLDDKGVPSVAKIVSIG